MVLGSRALGNMRDGGMPLYRIFGDRALTLIQNLLFGMNLSTYASGYRAFRRCALEKINFDAFGEKHRFDTEVLVDAKDHGLNMVEVSVSTIYRGEKSHYNLVLYSLQVVLIAVKYRISKIWNSILGRQSSK